MCRWLAYSGAPVPMEDLIVKPERSLIDQSMNARLGETTTNGDGFGLGWYGDRAEPGIYRSVRPAWNDRNLHDLAAQVDSRLFFAHVRATTGSAVQQTNCHPFRRGRWLFMHNGLVRGFRALKRELTMAVDPELYPDIAGSTDSEIMFFLSLTFGLEEEPIPAVERMAGFIEAVASSHGVAAAVEMTLGISDGDRIIAIRYATDGESRSLFHNQSLDALSELNPAIIERYSRQARVVVSEPFGDMNDAWLEIPESTALVAEDGDVRVRPFVPARPN